MPDDVNDAEPIPYETLASEVENGLPNERRGLDRALENQAFYDHDDGAYLPAKEAQNEYDRQAMSTRSSGLLRQVVSKLCEHLYSPGPNRNVAEDDDADDFLQVVYEQNHIDLLLHETDVLATTNDVAAVQADPGDGEFDERPIDLILWSREEFHVWTHPRNPRRPVAVVTIDRYDNRRRYKLWTETTVQEFATEKLKDDQTAGGILSKPSSPREEHGFGRLPFAFWHYTFPSRFFWTSGHGTFLRKAQRAVDTRLTRLDESIDKHLNPIPIAENCTPEWQAVVEPMRFLKINAGNGPLDGMGMGGANPRLYFLQPTIAVEQTWFDLEQFVKQATEATGVPMSAVRMEQQDATSGIAIIAEQAPLLTRAKRRQKLAAAYESELAKMILTVAGNHYGKPGLAAAAPTLRLLLTWPEPEIPIPGPDRDDATKFELEQGFTSRLMEIQKRFGMTRDQAIKHLEQIKEDRLDENEADPPPGEVDENGHPLPVNAGQGPPDPDGGPDAPTDAPAGPQADVIP